MHRSIAAIATAMISTAAVAEAPRYMALPHAVRGMSADGTFVTANGAAGGFSNTGLVYNLADGTVAAIVNQSASTAIAAISSAGNFVAGVSGAGSPASTQAYRFSVGGNHSLIGKRADTASSYASAISGDGGVVVGYSDLYSQSPGVIIYPFRWTPLTGRQEIGPVNGLGGGQVLDLSRDGSTIVGNASTGAWVWRESGGFTYLPRLIPNRNPSAKAVSADGSIIVGTVHIEDNPLARRVAKWIGTDIHIIQQPAGFENPVVEDVSDDAGTIVGSVRVSGSTPTWGMICTPEMGIMLAHEYLSLHGVTIPAGVQIERVWAVSADGTTFGGSLRDGTGFVATVPAPATATLLAAAGLVAARRRRG